MADRTSFMPIRNVCIFPKCIKLFVFLESEKIIHNTNIKIKLKMGNLINNF